MNTIIPTSGFPEGHGETIDIKAVLCWIATGFFLESDSFWNELKWKELDFSMPVWEYNPRNILLDEAVEEFTEIIEAVTDELTAENKIILPLSGGIDSRTLAVALHKLNKKPYTYSYSFEGGHDETYYGKKISGLYSWPFEAFTVPRSYIWNNIEKIARTNQCYAEFTHARQAATSENISNNGQIWLLGHWGDVLFDNFPVDPDADTNTLTEYIRKKVCKPGGVYLSEQLWSHYGFDGTFEDHLTHRLQIMMDRIKINDARARLRAFKSMYWATRWTTTNLTFFSKYKPVALPYYDNRLCRFIMTLPESLLTGRKIQIEYIKRRSHEAAAVTWQSQKPFNLYNYGFNRTPYNIPYRGINFIKNSFYKTFLNKPLIQRNWELQFTGKENAIHLHKWIIDEKPISELVPVSIRKDVLDNFNSGNKKYWSHPLSMLLTLSLFCKLYK